MLARVVRRVVTDDGLREIRGQVVDFDAMPCIGDRWVFAPGSCSVVMGIIATADADAAVQGIEPVLATVLAADLPRETVVD